MVRVAGLLELDASDVPVRSADGIARLRRSPRSGSASASSPHARADSGSASSGPALASAGIEIATIDECSEREQEKLQRYFEREIYPILTPLAVGPGPAVPVRVGSLALARRDRLGPGDGRGAVRTREGAGGARPVRPGRRSGSCRSRLVISHFLPMLFPGMEISERALFRVTRDADFEVSDDADDLLEAVESELRRRRFGDVVRLELSASASRSDARPARGGSRRPPGTGLRDRGARSTSPSSGSSSRSTGRSSSTSRGLPSSRLVGHVSRRRNDVFEEIRRGDLLVHQPYDSFRASFEALAQAAARDPDVIAIKTAVYRTSDESSLYRSLIECAEEGKQSVCLVELKARFDERRNIEWSRAMEAGGRPRRPRLPRPEDPREDDARRPPRGGRPATLRPHRHRQLQRLDGAYLRGRRPLHRRRGDRGRRRRPLQLRHRLRPAAALPQAARGAVHDARAPRRRDPPRRRRGGRGPDRRGSGSSSTPSSTRRSSRSSTPPRRPVSPIEIMARVDLHAPPRREGPLRDDPGAPRSSAASSSTAGSTGSRPATTRASTSAAPT